MTAALDGGDFLPAINEVIALLLYTTNAVEYLNQLNVSKPHV
jgi:hypothetical protein